MDCFCTTDDIRMDMLGEELADDSNVWVAYVNTAVTHDTQMTDGWNKSLDVLLIFVCHPPPIRVYALANLDTRRVYSLPLSHHSLSHLQPCFNLITTK